MANWWTGHVVTRRRAWPSLLRLMGHLGVAQTRVLAAGDTLNSIENIVGSAFGDTLTGDAGANRLIGGDGRHYLQTARRTYDLISCDPTHPILGSGSIAVTEIASRSPSLTAIPDNCRIHVDRRLTIGESPDEALAEIERAHIVRVLETNQGNISKSARVLGIDRVTLYNKIKKYGIDLKLEKTSN